MTIMEPVREPAIGFVMGVAYRKIASLLQHRLKDFDITPEQWAVLYQIDLANGLIQKEIADRSGKDKPTTTRIIDHLEHKGLVRKQTGEQDRRSFLVFSTARGKALIQETLSLEQSVTEDVRQMMSQEEYGLLMELLQRISLQLGQQIEQEA